MHAFGGRDANRCTHISHCSISSHPSLTPAFHNHPTVLHYVQDSHSAMEIQLKTVVVLSEMHSTEHVCIHVCTPPSQGNSRMTPS